MQAIFSTLVDAPKHHLHFLFQLQQRVESWNDKSTVGDIFVEHVRYFFFFFFFFSFLKKLPSFFLFVTDPCIFLLLLKINKLTPYKTFVSNISAAKNMIMRCVITNPAFEEFLEDAMKDPMCSNTPLRELLDAPLQRIPRYKMLIKDLLGCTELSHPDFQKLAAAYNNVKIISEAIVSLKTKEENLKKLSVCFSSIHDCPVCFLSFYLIF
jgi:hypothetical protein